MMGWSQEQTDILRTLWDEGKSCSQIGNRLSKSRNAVIGKVHRLGLSGRKPGGLNISLRHTRRGKRKAVQRVSPPKFKSAAEPPREIPAAPECNPCSIMELDSTRCRWITGDPTQPFEKIYCGGETETETGKSYCEFHALASVSGRRGRSDKTRAQISRSHLRQKHGRLALRGREFEANT